MVKWIEQIRLRSSASALLAVAPDLQDRLQNLSRPHANAEAFVLQHAVYDGDLAVVVVWQADGPPQKSREGHLVADQLRRLGTVDHSVWCPIDGSKD